MLDSVSVRTVTEERRGDVPLFAHPEWTRWSWLVQGITARETGNFASFGEQTADVVQTRWRLLRQRTGTRRSVLGRQVHGATVLSHDTFADGMLFTNDADGHLTRVVGTLLAVSVADCVPVFIVDERARMVAVLHAGWRGVAAGILARGIKCMGGFIANTYIHLGPAICGDCYEVGPEVHAAIGLPEPATNAPIDLRAALARQAVDLGVAQSQITTSTYCTKCNDPPFFSHRAGHPERQVGIIGLTGASHG
jgi:YfiH family protein